MSAIGTIGNDYIYDEFALSYEGGQGDDVLGSSSLSFIGYGGEGNDVVVFDYGRNNNTAYHLLIAHGGGGNDWLINRSLSSGGDSLSGDGGRDVIEGGLGNDTLDGGGDCDSLWGRLGDDHLDGGDGDDSQITLVVAGSTALGDGFETSKLGGLYGGEGNDVLEGGAGSDSLDGGVGDDDLFGGTGLDVLSGGDGNDTLDGGSGSDWLYGGNGDDTLTESRGNDALYGENGNDIIATASFLGTASSGKSSVYGGDGEDRIYANGKDLVYGGDDADHIVGNAADQLLSGDTGNDVIAGGGGNDKIWGGDGLDILTGDAGKDVFYFDWTLSAETNVDTITDYQVKDDAISLDKTVFSALGSGSKLKSAQFIAGSDGKAHDASDRIIYETDTGKLFYDADGTGGKAAILFAQLDANLAMKAGEFILV
ncbi:calcium-binding protein [Rhizobium sp. YIM 134829]|uniref:calcium-binding protein n=1 Tax=Rhizobium sp. YIM 134829 TaxID=3390453 RepID=UPI00397BB809